MSRHERTFRVLLRLYPAGFRVRYGGEMTRLFLADLDVARDAGRAAVLGVWATATVDAVRTAPAERIHERRSAPRRARSTGPDVELDASGRAPGLWTVDPEVIRGTVAVISATPGVLAVMIIATAPGYIGGSPPSFLDIATISVVLVSAVASRVAWLRPGRPARVAAAVSVIAFIACIFGPSIVLIVIGLGFLRAG